MEPKKKLLFVITEFYKGGAEVALINLFNALSPQEFNIDFIILSQRNNEGSLVDEVPNWVNVCNAGEINQKNNYPGSEKDFLLGGRAAKEFVCGKIYDIAFSYGEWCRLEFVAEMVEAHEKEVWIHTDIVESAFFEEEYFFSYFLTYRYYIFVSETTRKNAIEKYPFIEKKSCVIHNVLDYRKLCADSEAYIPDMNVNALNRFITVANVRHEKGYLRMLDVATELKKRKIPFCWNCIGRFSDTTLTEKIQSEIKKRGLEGQLILRGPMDNPHPYTKNSELFVLLSDYEAWPLAMAEAMMLDVPAVATKTAGASEHIQNKENGILTSFNISAIVEEIEEFIYNGELRNRIKSNVKDFKFRMDGIEDFKQFIDQRIVRRSTMERLNFGHDIPYNATEAAIHLNRYSMVKSLCADKTVLDAACGEGYGSFLMKKWGAASVDGVDIDKDTIEHASKLFASENVRFHTNTVEKLPFPDYTFDLIVSFETMEHVDNPDMFLKEMKRVLKPDGIIILSCPNDLYYYPDESVSNPFHKRKYNFFEFKEFAENYLGTTAEYYLGFAIDGFLNMPISYSTNPSEYKSDSILEMFNYTECRDAICVKQERYINHWNSNYYVGVWGGKSQNQGINTVVFPRETFFQVKDEDIALMKEISQWKEEKEYYEKTIEKMKLDKEDEIDALKCYFASAQEKEYNDLIKKHSTLVMEHERMKMMFELCNKEREALFNSVYSSCDSLMHERNQKEELLRSKEEISSLLVTAQNELNIMKSTKGYKILNFIYRVRCKLGLVK